MFQSTAPLRMLTNNRFKNTEIVSIHAPLARCDFVESKNVPTRVGNGWLAPAFLHFRAITTRVGKCTPLEYFKTGTSQARGFRSEHVTLKWQRPTRLTPEERMPSLDYYVKTIFKIFKKSCHN